MTRRLDSLQEIAGLYDAIVFDQWGVLHNGSTAYPGAVACLERLSKAGHRLAVLSNSGKRAAPNADRIAGMGFAPTLFDQVMTSGEALWRDMAENRVAEKRFWPVQRAAGDAAAWAAGLDIELVADPDEADAVLLMGLPDGSVLADWSDPLDRALMRNLPLYCSNPDRASPRANGLVISPGTLAFAYRDSGGDVTFYGKPHLPIFEALQAALAAERLLMVGDSPEQDIAGAQAAGWDSLLIEDGLLADVFAKGDTDAALIRLAAKHGCKPPTYSMGQLR